MQTMEYTVMNSPEKSLDKSIVKILRAGNDAQIHFPAVPLNQQKAVEFTLTNQSDTNVNWRAFSKYPAFLKGIQGHTTVKSDPSIFDITPKSGIIPPRQKQAINIEFCPRGATGVFTQIFTLETRDDKENIEQLSYSCQLVLSGQAMSQILIRLNGHNTQLSCNMKGKCVWYLWYLYT